LAIPVLDYVQRYGGLLALGLLAIRSAPGSKSDAPGLSLAIQTAMGAAVGHDDGIVAARPQMSGLVAIAAFGLVLILVLIWFLVFVPRDEEVSRKPEPTEKPAVAGLSTPTAIPLEIVFGIDDYLKLRTRPELKSTCVRLRRDRRRIALLWLADLQRDVHLVWEFRRFLVSNGLTVTFRDEVAIGIETFLALLCVGATRIVVMSCGPFFLRQVAQIAFRPVELLGSRAALLLVRAPAAVRTQLEQKWAKHVLTLNPA
jgi:hypothetical protein